jgi:hypothetical protein
MEVRRCGGRAGRPHRPTPSRHARVLLRQGELFCRCDRGTSPATARAGETSEHSGEDGNPFAHARLAQYRLEGVPLRAAQELRAPAPAVPMLRAGSAHGMSYQ